MVRCLLRRQPSTFSHSMHTCCTGNRGTHQRDRGRGTLCRLCIPTLFAVFDTALNSAFLRFQMARTQKNKATEYHLGRLKAQLAKLRTQLQEPAPGTSTKAGEGFEVSRYGDARIAMVGFPSVGKSSLLTRLTGTKSVAAACACPLCQLLHRVGPADTRIAVVQTSLRH
jgi:GTPase involved in cell partitioning and DNA repair